MLLRVPILWRVSVATCTYPARFRYEFYVYFLSFIKCLDCRLTHRQKERRFGSCWWSLTAIVGRCRHLYGLAGFELIFNRVIH